MLLRVFGGLVPLFNGVRLVRDLLLLVSTALFVSSANVVAPSSSRSRLRNDVLACYSAMT
jgi:hypothetical protein